MKVIADSSSTRTEWSLVDGEKVVEHVTTEGLNPYLQTRREISHIVRLELPDAFFKRRWEHVYFYGAGCANPERSKIMEASLVAQFRTPVTVMSDITGAARGLLIDKPGMACILGTGSNSCLYDGEAITANVPWLGYILGDEGSGSYLGKSFLGDCLKGIAPAHIRERIFQLSGKTPEDVAEEVNGGPMPNRTLSEYATYLEKLIDDPYVYQLVYSGIMKFFTRNIAGYGTIEVPVSFVGSVACRFSDILYKVANSFGLTIDKVVRSSMPGLIKYHSIR